MPVCAGGDCLPAYLEDWSALVRGQVSRLVILHEEAEDGNAMPDLEKPVLAVSKAVVNLVKVSPAPVVNLVKVSPAPVVNLIKVGRSTIESSEDPILKQDMPAALHRVEAAARLLEEASALLKSDPYSQPARKKLIEGARGILQGTSSLLLCFDESEVRKIIRECKKVLDYLAVAEVIETMEDLVQFVRDLSPCLTKVSREVDHRSQELTHQVHREILSRCLESVKTLSPILICSMKIFIQILHQHCKESDEAAENRNYLAGRMSDEINEIIRVLQLTTYDEEEWDADNLTVMKKALNAVFSKQQPAHDWLMDDKALRGGVGEKSLRQMLELSRRVAERALPPDRDSIRKLASDVSSMADALCELRQEGKGATPQGQSLARSIEQKLQELRGAVSRAVSNTERSGVQQPAHTVAGQLEQAQRWLANPAMDDRGLGQQAIGLIVEEGRKVASCLSGGSRSEIQRLCDEVDGWSSQLSELCRRGEGNSPQANTIAKALSTKLQELKNRIQTAVVDRMVEDFADIATPLKQFTDATLAPEGTPGRAETFEDRGRNLSSFSNRAAKTARMVAAGSTGGNKKAAEALLSSASQVESLTPQLVAGGRIRMSFPSNEAADEHFENLRREYADRMERVRDLADELTDSAAFIKASEEVMRRHTVACEQAIADGESQAVVGNVSNIARLVSRVLMVAKQEADNSEDPSFVAQVKAASANLEAGVSPMVLNAKAVAVNPGDELAVKRWRDSNQALLNALGEVRRAVMVYPEEDAIPAADMARMQLNASQAFQQPVVDLPSIEEDLMKMDFSQIFAPPLQPPKPTSSLSTHSLDVSHIINDSFGTMCITNHISSPWLPSGSRSVPEWDVSPQSSLGRYHRAPESNWGHHGRDHAPPRPPLPGGDRAPPRPPPPETDDEEEHHMFSKAPLPSQPIMVAAHGLHQEVKQWSSRDNDIIAAAKKMALLMARLSQLVRGEGGTKKDLIACAKSIAEASEEVTRLAKDLARECTDKRMRTNLLQVCERIPTIGTQLKILSTVKATMLGAQERFPRRAAEMGSEEDQEATEMLVGNAQNLMQSVKETVRAAEAASIKIRTDAGIRLRWIRKQPWYQY
ncbi:Vinculin/alpha-catenin [Trinorchestia longiramus]|nr:Vinculin/alpha-catenin [Trinorchestia longiramus]